LRFNQRLTVAVESSVLEMKAVAGYADDAFDQGEIGLAGFDEDDDVAVSYGTIMHEGEQR
jgi:hypothetical protein